MEPSNELRPPELLDQQYDAVIIYSNSSEDHCLALKIRECLEKFVEPLADGKQPQICVFEDMLQSTNRLKQLEEAVNRSTYMIVLVTRHFAGDNWGCQQKDACIETSLSTPDKKECIIPFFACSRSERGELNVPFGLRCLTGFYLTEAFSGFDGQDFSVEKIKSLQPNKNFLSKMQKLFNFRLNLKVERQARWRKFGRLNNCDYTNSEAVEHDENTVDNGNFMVYQKGPKLLTSSEIPGIIEPFANGRFSTIYSGKWFGNNIVIKQSKAGKDLKDDMKRAEKHYAREKALSFLRHPSLLPVLAYCDETLVWKTLLFPYKKNGDLENLLKNEDGHLPGNCTWKDLLRICYQAAMGLAFLHRGTYGRQAIRHGDIRPSNILLDEHYNACIGDMGSAMEMPTSQTTVTTTDERADMDCFTDPLIGTTHCMSVKNDVYSFGIVLLQVLLTSVCGEYDELTEKMGAHGGWTHQNISQTMKEMIWCPYKQECLDDANKTQLINLVLDCKKTENRVSASALLEQLKEVNKTLKIQHYIWSKNTACVMCHFYRPATNMGCCWCDVSRFCAGCLMSNHINPLFCPDCGLCQPPIGGENTHALFIAGGGDGHNIFSKDVRRMFNWMSDPRVGGIRQENITCMHPDSGKCNDASLLCNEENVVRKLEELEKKLAKCVNKPFVLLYISCHKRMVKRNGKGTSLLSFSGTEKGLATADFKKILSSLRVKLLLCILDCCYAGENVIDFEDNSDQPKELIQWSSCYMLQTSSYEPDGKTSTFTRHIIAGLTQSQKCPKANDTDRGKSDCVICNSFLEGTRKDQCVVFSELQEYVSRHMENTDQRPIGAIVAPSTKIKLAYCGTDLKTKVLFIMENGSRALLFLDHTLTELGNIYKVKLAIYRKLIELHPQEKEKDDFIQLIDVVYMTSEGTMEQVKGNEEDQFNKIRQLYDRFDALECLLNEQKKSS